MRGSVTEVESNRPPGIVIEQSPAPGTMVRPGTSVDLVISSFPQVDVPDLRGMTEQQARSAIENTQGRIRLGTITYKSSGDCYKPVDKVIEQGPQPGQKVRVGTEINLVILRSPIC